MLSKIISKKQTIFFRSVSALSFACLVHCALVPIVMIFLPLGIQQFFVEYEWLEGVILSISLGLAIYSAIHSYRYHHNKKTPLVLLGLAAVLLIIHIIIQESNNVFVILGISLMLASQLLNYLFCRRSEKCHHSHYSCDEKHNAGKS